MSFRYYVRPVGEKILTYLPLGKHIYNGMGYLANWRSRGTPHLGSSLPLIKQAKALVPPHGTILEIGTGWFHRDAFLVSLVGDYRVYLFDVEDKARLRYIKTYLQYLLRDVNSLARDLDIDPDAARARLTRLLACGSREEIYAACNFVPVITRDVAQPFLPEQSIDYMMGHCVLNHIPIPVLIPELRALGSILKNDGHMFVMIGHDDHWSHYDDQANMFTYYGFSDRVYRLFFENAFEFQNRLVKEEWLPIFRSCGFDVKEYDAFVTEESQRDIAALPKLDTRFARYSLQDLAIVHSYVLLRTRPAEHVTRPQ